MRLLTVCEPDLPGLAWYAEVSGGVTTAWHGPWVETSPETYFEGAWDGPFAARGFIDSPAFMGSGARVTDTTAEFATPSHNLDGLFAVRLAGRVAVSNSLPFLLQRTGLNLDPAYPLYRDALWSHRLGLRRRTRHIPTAEGLPIQLVRYATLVVDAASGVRVRSKPRLSGWPDFAAYEAFLADAIARLTQNAADPARAHYFDPLVAVSSGYDSTAAAALAADAGCREAVTFTRGHAYADGGGVQPDNGAPIAEALGMHVTEFKPKRVREVPASVMAEFAACGDTFDLQFGALESMLGGRLLFTGHPGVYWRLDVPAADGMSCLSPAGSGLTEFRLRTGFVHVPVPALGAMRHDDIFRISNSPEMRPWTLGNAYDRPIARRILETRGVPREAFGQAKRGSFRTVQLGFRDRGRAAALGSFRPPLSRQDQARRASLSLARLAMDGSAHVASRAAFRLRLTHTLPAARYIGHVPGRSSWVVPWGISVVASRYRRPP